MSLQTIMYNVEGFRVTPMNRAEIEIKAQTVAKELGFTKRNRKKLDLLIDRLNKIVTIDLLSDEEWKELTLGLTKAHFSPNEMTIRIPETTYELASKGDQQSLEILFHELGHVLLAHQQLLHKENTPAQPNENAEWQADVFAEAMLECIGYQTKQLQFNF